MKVPVRIPVAGKLITIEYLLDLPEGIAGDTSSGSCRIRISKSRNKTEREVFDTLFHELLHVALDITGHSVEWTAAKEEPIVYALENALASLFTFNKHAAIRWREIDWDE